MPSANIKPTDRDRARPRKVEKPSANSGIRFESVRLENLFEVLDALAWLDHPSAGDAAQFAGIDPRTSGKVLKNAALIGLVEDIGTQRYRLRRPYPHKGDISQKQNVVRDALLKLPLLVSARQFLKLGSDLKDAVRKAASVQG